MGTRSTTLILDESNQPILNMYRQFDGYAKGHGKDMADYLKGMTVINGIGGGDNTKNANGMGCLALQLVCHFKKKIGNFYANNLASEKEGYHYTVYLKGDEESVKLHMKLECGKEVLFDGPACDFDAEKVEPADSE